jgi:hypothetical protein
LPSTQPIRTFKAALKEEPSLSNRQRQANDLRGGRRQLCSANEHRNPNNVEDEQCNAAHDDGGGARAAARHERGDERSVDLVRLKVLVDEIHDAEEDRTKVQQRGAR